MTAQKGKTKVITMIRYKVRDVTFECEETAGIAHVRAPDYDETFQNAIEGWNSFTSLALRPMEIDLRDRLEENGFNRWTGNRRFDYTESEIKAIDEINNARNERSYPCSIY